MPESSLRRAVVSGEAEKNTKTPTPGPASKQQNSTVRSESQSAPTSGPTSKQQSSAVRSESQSTTTPSPVSKQQGSTVRPENQSATTSGSASKQQSSTVRTESTTAESHSSNNNESNERTAKLKNASATLRQVIQQKARKLRNLPSTPEPYIYTPRGERLSLIGSVRGRVALVVVSSMQVLAIFGLPSKHACTVQW
jgi:predicted component of type VI protein secretion system